MPPNTAKQWTMLFRKLCVTSDLWPRWFLPKETCIYLILETNSDTWWRAAAWAEGDGARLAEADSCKVSQLTLCRKYVLLWSLPTKGLDCQTARKVDLKSCWLLPLILQTLHFHYSPNTKGSFRVQCDHPFATGAFSPLAWKSLALEVPKSRALPSDRRVTTHGQVWITDKTQIQWEQEAATSYTEISTLPTNGCKETKEKRCRDVQNRVRLRMVSVMFTIVPRIYFQLCQNIFFFWNLL